MQISRLQTTLLSIVVAFALTLCYSFTKSYDNNLRSNMHNAEITDYFFDESSSLSLTDIIDQDILSLQPDNTAIKIKNAMTGTHWFRVKPLELGSLQSDSRPPKTQNARFQAIPNGITEYYLQAELAWIDQFTFFMVRHDQHITTLKIGDDDPFTNRSVAFRKPVMQISEPNEVEAIYISIKAQGRISLPLVFIPETTFHQQTNFDHLFYGAIFAILIALGVYNFFLYLSLRDLSYLYYIAYIFAFGFTQVIASGLGQQYLWPNTTGLSTLLAHIFLGLTNFTIVFFVISFLGLKKNLPLFYKLLMGFACISLSCLPLLFIIDYFPLKYLLHGMSFAIMASIFPCSIIMVLRGNREAAFMLASNLVLFPSISIGLLRFLGFFENAFWAEHAAELGIIIEAIILSFGLADRIHSLRLDKIKAVQQRQLDQELFSKRIIQTQEREKRELGKTLHDSLGHQLLIIQRLINSIGENKSINLSNIDKANETIAATIEDVRNLSHLVYPAILDHLGLKASLHAVLDGAFSNTAIKWELHFTETSIPYDQQLLIYRATQECANNIVKHAKASRCKVSIGKNKESDNTIQLTICDNGEGIVKTQSSGFGLDMLKQHALILGGQLCIFGNKPQGTEIRLTL